MLSPKPLCFVQLLTERLLLLYKFIFSHFILLFLPGQHGRPVTCGTESGISHHSILLPFFFKAKNSFLRKYSLWGGRDGSVVGQKLFFSDLDLTFQEISDPDPDPISDPT